MDMGFRERKGCIKNILEEQFFLILRQAFIVPNKLARLCRVLELHLCYFEVEGYQNFARASSSLCGNLTKLI